MTSVQFCSSIFPPTLFHLELTVCFTHHLIQIKHAKFYNACKRHNAVKEAFRFTQLIKKPSLSTYNQLLSVCAKAKDIQGEQLVIIISTIN